MSLGIRSKLFVISVALILSVGLGSGVYLQHELRGFLEQRIEAELLRQAQGARALVERSVTGEPAMTIAVLEPVARALAAAFESRVTVIAPDGRVLGDSDLSPAEVAAVDNHGGRPEVLQALAGTYGQSRRHSNTLRTDMLYVAVAWGHGAERGVVRVARPLAEVDQAVSRLRALLLVAGLVGLFITILMSGLASHFMSRTLRQLAYSARAISRGTGDRSALHVPIPVQSQDEIGKLAGSINRMAGDISATVSTLASERARFEAALEGMSEAVIALDGERRIRVMNSAALALFGLSKTQPGEPLIDHVRVPALHELLAEPTRPGTGELVLPGTPPRQVLARISPEQDGKGCIVVLHDVTEFRRLQTMRRDFVANVSHELRTPVSIIRANAETLLDGAMSDPVHGTRLLDALHRNAERLSSLISDLLELSKIEAGRYPVARETVDVAEIARHAVASVESAARDKSLDVAIRVSENLTLRGDPQALEQILVNYLDNGVKYTPAGGHIEVRATAAGGHIRVEVADNGPGIPPHLYERVFERFFRVDPGRSREMGGTGLGLAIVKHLAEAMDGTAGVDPVEPHGACFWVLLPAA